MLVTVWQQFSKGKSFWVLQDKYVVFVCFHSCIAVTFVLEHHKQCLILLLFDRGNQRFFNPCVTIDGLKIKLNGAIKSSGKAINSIKARKNYRNLDFFGLDFMRIWGNFEKLALSFKMLLEGFQNEGRNSEL